MGDVQTTASLPSAEVPVPGPATDAPAARPDPPTTVHQAYCRGWDAARHGEDLTAVVFDACMTWSLDDIHLWCELVASASLGHWTGMEGRPEP